MHTQHGSRAIVGAMAAAARRWSDADFPPRVRATGRIVARTGYSRPVVEYALDRLFETLDAPALEAAIAAELGGIEILDRFVRAPGGRARAMPVGRVAILSSRTTIGVALLPASFALAAKCAVEVKDREDGLIDGFFATLREELPELPALARAYDGERDAGLAGFDAVAAFGSDATLDAIAAGLPSRVRFIGYGSKLSAGYVGREALDGPGVDALLAAIARDVLLYDTEGCLSLHLLFVERGAGIDARATMQHLDVALRQTAIEFPPGADFRGAAAVRDGARFRASQGLGSVHAGDAAAYLLVLDPPRDAPPPLGPRTLAVFAVDAPADAAGYLRAHRLALEAIAIAPRRDDILAFALATGAARIARFGALQSPPPAYRHGGRPRIAEFVRWVWEDA